MRYVTVRFPVADNVDVYEPQALRRAVLWTRNPEVLGVVEGPDEADAPVAPIHGHDPTEGVEVVVTTNHDERAAAAKQNFAIRHSRGSGPPGKPDKTRGPR